MAETVAPEFARFVAAERQARRLPASVRVTAEGQVLHSVFVAKAQIEALMRVAARRASGMLRPSKRTEVVWVEGENEIAIGFSTLTVGLASGFIRVGIPVRCDQIGSGRVDVTFAVGSPQAPAGLFAATYRRPAGPELVVSTWGEALVAFAWQCLLGFVTSVAGATGKDHRGNLLIPVELAAGERGIEIVPMARYRFAGNTSLESKPVVSP